VPERGGESTFLSQREEIERSFSEPITAGRRGGRKKEKGERSDSLKEGGKKKTEEREYMAAKAQKLYLREKGEKEKAVSRERKKGERGRRFEPATQQKKKDLFVQKKKGRRSLPLKKRKPRKSSRHPQEGEKGRDY